MNFLSNHEVQCPYCGETIEVLIDGSVAEQEYIEDCQVCCRPIEFQVVITDANIEVWVRHENE